MRLLLIFLASLTVLVSKAQTPAGSGLGFLPWQQSLDVNPISSWQVRPYASVSAGYIFAGRGISYLYAPVGVALYHPLTGNLTAFAAATIAPTVFNFNTFNGSPMAKPYGNTFGGLNLNTGISGGLIYTNDAKTFSISGSLSVQRSSYPVYVPAKTTTTRQY